jgi:hypothetical protein
MRSKFLEKTAPWAVAIAAVFALSGCKPPQKGGEVKEKVKVEFYVMSQCPFGTQVQKGIKPVLDKMGAWIDYTENFIANEMPGGTFNSLHGENEVKGDIAQLCMAKHYPENHKYMDAVFCMADDQKNIPTNWKNCAAKAGMDAAKIQTCIDGDEGKKLMGESIKKSNEAKASGSPTIVINGEKYSGGRTDKDFETAICCAFKPENKPATCPATLNCPKRVPVDLTVISDKRCKECGQRTEMMIRNFKDRFPKLNVKELDYGEPAGRELFERTKVGFLPAYLFDQNLKEDSGYATIQRWVQPAGDYLIMMTGSNFDPTKEICDNGTDDTGNGKIDCDDEDCKGQIVCREERSNTLDLFVMAWCPFGTKAVDSMKEVLGNFKTGLSFGLHFLVNVLDEEKFNAMPPMRKSRCVKKPDNMYYCSLHGEEELNEDLRQVCAMKYFGKANKYMDYIWCRNKDLKNPDWKKCATEAKIDAAKIEKCSTGQEGLDLIQADAKLAEDLQFSGSPSFLGNNKEKLMLRDRSPEGIKTGICNINKELKGCENKLTSESPPGTPGGAPMKAPSGGSCG